MSVNLVGALAAFGGMVSSTLPLVAGAWGIGKGCELMWKVVRKIEEKKIQPFFRPEQFYSNRKASLRKRLSRNNLAKKFYDQELVSKKQDKLRFSTPKSKTKLGSFPTSLDRSEFKGLKKSASPSRYNSRDVEASASPSLRTSNNNASPSLKSPRQTILFSEASPNIRSKASIRRQAILNSARRHSLDHDRVQHDKYVESNASLIEDIKRNGEEKKVQLQISQLVRTNFSPCLCPEWESLCLQRCQDQKDSVLESSRLPDTPKFKPISAEKIIGFSTSTPKLKPVASFQIKKTSKKAGLFE